MKIFDKKSKKRVKVSPDDIETLKIASTESEVSSRLAGETWGTKVVFASELPGCDDCGEPFCEKHGLHYAYCKCVGPREYVDTQLVPKWMKNRM